MLTGRPPFVGDSPREIISAHFLKEPDPVRKLNPSVPKRLADTIMRCLAKDPADRFPDARELSAELQRVSFGDVHPSDETPPNFAWPFFAGCAVMALSSAMLANQIRGLDRGTQWWVAGGFALIATLCSPVARASTEPWSEQLRSWTRNRMRRAR